MTRLLQQTELPKKIGMDHEAALKHLKTCEHLPHACPLGCGAVLHKNEMEAHMTKCKNYSETCEKCGLIFYPNIG